MERVSGCRNEAGARREPGVAFKHRTNACPF
ncbi:hypothetical protein X961_2534 [Burkholderia pseudomallei MSHR5613]|nr:hypothetical protein DO73_4240 [Burkholderia pseudomallei]KGC60744.1 hypothetical protein DM75_2874 [Burkholderia mallei]KGS22616.1 hypothetical protein X962_5267 [Burkholderia pseudomallei MSHR7343]KGS28043.1 hypothetical protein X941_3793 [Burkholderia pseudomallei MSHR5569]KGS40590.1 hypothetical protein X992_1153 [Burkholderia pseudomallei MSHR5492]KGS50880.1 hypothetical protein X961_2534 [Burkholderia pseudomallei MSHR5613]KGS65309.1 hypothetical protein X990_4275 [Burkholderia pseud